uniref:Uncharacterized protein n=1 Tax=Nelumbo nucifera TaxID=4432 RepID=A0A822YAT0_NELNU|nr:TPA_asm: hypothetical protein HUJ06_010065 [Nelumbo nucifera]
MKSLVLASCPIRGKSVASIFFLFFYVLVDEVASQSLYVSLIRTPPLCPREREREREILIKRSVC